MVENLTANIENRIIHSTTAETMVIENAVFFIDLSILSPAEKMR